MKLVVDPNEDCTENCPDGLDSITPAPSVLSDNRKNNPVSTIAEKKAEEPDTIDLIVKKEVRSHKMIYHTVQAGDTLWNIAQRYQATVAEIKKINRITNGKFLKAGTRIKVPIIS